MIWKIPIVRTDSTQFEVIFEPRIYQILQLLFYNMLTMQAYFLKNIFNLIKSINLKFPSPLNEWSLFAVFDGHGGPQTSWMASSQLFNFILRQPEIQDCFIHLCSIRNSHDDLFIWVRIEKLQYTKCDLNT